MPLPSSGQISFADLNEELGNASNSQLDMDSAAIEFNLTRPHRMDEFYGLSIGTDFTFADWTGIVGISEFGAISATLGNAVSRTINTSNFGVVTSSTPRTINITIVVPSTFNGQPVDNAGTSLTGTKSATQPAIGTYLDISVNDTLLAGQETQITLTINDIYYTNTPWTLDYTGTLIPISIIPASGNGDDSFNVIFSENTSGTTRDVRFTVTSASGKSDFVDVTQTSYTPILQPSISITSVSPTSPYPYGETTLVTFTISRANASTFNASISPAIDGNNAVFPSLQPSGITYNGPTSISGTGTTFRVSVPERTDGESATKDSFLTVNVSTGGGSDSDSFTIQQEGFVLPVFSWNGGVSIGRNDGIVSITQGNSTTQPTVSPTSFAVRTTNTPNRTVTVSNVTIPSGFQNAGTILSPFNVSVVQLAAQELLNIVSSTGIGVSGQGENFTITVETTDVYETEWTAELVYVESQNNSTNWVLLSAGLSDGSSAIGDGEIYVFVDPNYPGSNGYDGTTRYFDIRVNKVGGGLSSNLLEFIQNTGTAPVQKPTFTISPTSRTWTYAQSGTSQVQTLTATHTGGSTPTSVSFFLSPGKFGLFQTDSNVPVTVSDSFWVAEAINDGAGSFQVGVYPLTQNSGTSNKEETLSISMGNSGGTNSVTAQMIQGFNIDWETNVSSLSFGTGGGTQNITLTTSLNWTAAVSGTGFSINTTSGTAGTQTISVTATQKDLGGGGTVTFSASGQTPIVVSLSQAAAPLEYDWFVNGLQRSGNFLTVEPSTQAQSYSVGLYAYRGSTAVASTWMLQRTSGTFITINTTTSGGTSFATTTSGQNTSGTPNLYLNVATNTGSARNGGAEITVDGAFIATINVEQSGVSGGGGGGTKPEPGDEL